MPNQDENPPVQVEGKPLPRSIVPIGQRFSANAGSAVIKRKTQRVNTDPLVKAFQDKRDTPEIVDSLLLELAKEAAALSFAIEELDQSARDSSRLTIARTGILAKMAAVSMDRGKLGVEVINPRSPKVQAMFGLWIDAMKKVAAEVLPREHADLFFTKLTASLSKWEEQAEAIMEGDL